MEDLGVPTFASSRSSATLIFPLQILAIHLNFITRWPVEKMRNPCQTFLSLPKWPLLLASEPVHWKCKKVPCSTTRSCGRELKWQAFKILARKVALSSLWGRKGAVGRPQDNIHEVARHRVRWYTSSSALVISLKVPRIVD